jgi:membrane-bound inhibitor of C-type lysozyme
MKNALVAVIACLFISSCAVFPVEKKQLFPGRTVFYYSCDKDATFTAVFDKDSDTFHITGFKGVRILNRAASASGARYTDGEMVYWSKGNDATLEYKGKTYTCSIDEKKSDLAGAKARGVDFIASDEGKTWLLEISGDTLTLYTGNGTEKTIFEKAVITPRRDITIYKSSNEGHQIEVVIGGEGCHQQTARADITFDRLKLIGCGKKIK